MRSPWEFDYAPVARDKSEAESDFDMIVATERAIEPAELGAAVGNHRMIERVLELPPLHWLRVRSEHPVGLREIEAKLRDAGLPVRYVASAHRPSTRVTAAANFAATSMPTPSPIPHPDGERGDPLGQEGWFLGADGIDLDRSVCGVGSSTRLAVIDNDGGKLDTLDLDGFVVIGRPPPDPRSFSCHGASLVAWATRSKRVNGIAPGASARLFCIPKPGDELVTLPLAVATAVAQGADVIACATYLDTMTCPMLDDALQMAARAGRGGLGAAVVFAASREMSSADGLLHSSLSLDLGDPASDPRVICASASGRSGGWFLWRDKAGRLRPFANRGPAVRFIAPGADVVDPFAPDRLKHAESSGATAFVAGVTLLVMANAPDLTLSELDAVLTRTAQVADPVVPLGVASPRELLPSGRDRDGHDAKHGYGRLSATNACLAVRDPLAFALIDMGEHDVARAYHRLRSERRIATCYSEALGRHAARLLLHDERALHALKVILRHLRLVAGHERRASAHTPGALARQLALFIDMLATHPAPRPIAIELDTLARRARAATESVESRRSLESAVLAAAELSWQRG